MISKVVIVNYVDLNQFKRDEDDKDEDKDGEREGKLLKSSMLTKLFKNGSDINEFEILIRFFKDILL